MPPCPRLTTNPTKGESQRVFQTNEVTVKAHQTGFKYTDHYESLAAMWSEWNRCVLKA